MAKDAKGHGSEKRGGTFDRLNEMRKRDGYAPMSESRRGVHNFLDYMAGDGPMPDAMVAAKLAAGNPKADKAPVHPAMTFKASASENPRSKSPDQQDYQERTYSYKGSNSKRGINWALKKVQREFPDHRRHEVEIKKK